jgi:hypothetical protein
MYLVLPLTAYEPTWYVGTYGLLEGYSDNTPLYAGVRFSGIGSWRTYSENGFLALYGSAEASRYVTPAQVLEDRFKTGIEAGTKIGTLRLRTDASSLFSFNHLSYGLYAAPSWTLNLALQDGLGAFTPSVEYFGSYSYQQQDVDDTLVQGAAAELAYDPSIYQGYNLRISGAWELRPDQYRLDASGSATGVRRQDLTATAELSADGLLGYFADWETTASFGLRHSNANRHVDADNTTTENSEDRLTAGCDSQFNWSPTRSLSLTAGIFGEGAWYTERKALDASESLTSTPLRVYRTGGSVQSDINLSEHLYLVLRLSGLRSFSTDPEFDRWQFILRGGLEYSF